LISRNPSLSQKVVQAILRAVRKDSLAAEDGKLPSELELAQHFGVSRATVREALSNLEQRGVVIRKQGVGTYVAAAPRLAEWNLGHLAEGLKDTIRRSGLAWRLTDTAVAERASNEQEARALGIAIGTTVLSYARVILIEGEYVAHMQDVVPANLLKTAGLGDPLPFSVWDVLRERDDLALSHALTDLTVEPAPPTIAGQLQVKPSYMLLKLESRMITAEGSCVDHTLAYFVPGRFKFQLIRPVGSTADLAALLPTFNQEVQG
jgi:GntR family transcriptional regulator